MSKSRIWVALCVALFWASASQAGSISYYLDQSNRLSDGVNYLLVTISDDGKDGVIDFKVEALQPLIDLAGDQFGIQMFGFNVVGGTRTEARSVSRLPDGWKVHNGGRMDGFGLFDITMEATRRGHDDSLKTNGNGHDEHGNGKGLGHDGALNLVEPLTFSIVGVKLDDLLSYVDLSTGRAPEGFSFFFARVTGLNLGDCDPGKGTPGTCDNSAYFGGTSAVPAPGALWLMGTGVAGLVVRRLRGGRRSTIA
jgi:hypothetical protein